MTMYVSKLRECLKHWNVDTIENNMTINSDIYIYMYIYSKPSEKHYTYRNVFRVNAIKAYENIGELSPLDIVIYYN